MHDNGLFEEMFDLLFFAVHGGRLAIVIRCIPIMALQYNE